jgi:hypothetical protein
MPPRDAPQIPLTLDVEALTPLIRAIVAESLAAINAKLPAEQIGYSEEHAAQVLDLNRWQLRDLRRKGKIRASMVCGKRPRYSRQDLLEYLAKTRV